MTMLQVWKRSVAFLALYDPSSGLRASPDNTIKGTIRTQCHTIGCNITSFSVPLYGTA